MPTTHAEWLAAGGGAGILTAKATLTDTQIRGLPTTGVEIVPAPGENKQLVFVAGAMRLHSTVAYTNITSSADPTSSGLSLTFSADDNMLASNYVHNNFLSNAADYIAMLTQRASNLDPMANGNDLASDSSDPASITNQPLMLQSYNDDGDFTGGDSENTLDVWVAYLQVDLS